MSTKSINKPKTTAIHNEAGCGDEIIACSELQKQLIRKIKHHLVDRDMCGADLCKLTGISTPVWSACCRGKQSLSLKLLKKIADARDLTITVEFIPKVTNHEASQK